MYDLGSFIFENWEGVHKIRIVHVPQLVTHVDKKDH